MMETFRRPGATVPDDARGARPTEREKGPSGTAETKGLDFGPVQEKSAEAA